MPLKPENAYLSGLLDSDNYRYFKCFQNLNTRITKSQRFGKVERLIYSPGWHPWRISIDSVDKYFVSKLK